MERTTALDFREQMKTWMDLASTEPVKITRKNGQAFILVDADKFHEMELELANLRGLTAGLLDAASENTRPLTDQAIAQTLESGKSKALTRKTKKVAG
jgi:PHD/YefM family antitoxin component YafN of YafNO toxin-antitoxin module